MWIVVGALSAVVVVASVALLAVVARLLPPGRGREVAGFVPNCIVLLRRLRADRRLPRRARLALGVALGYVVSPLQLIPNIIPVIGQTDDLAVVMLALRYACRGLPRDEVRAAWPGNPDHLDRLLGRPASVRRSLTVDSDRSPRRAWASEKRLFCSIRGSIHHVRAERGEDVSTFGEEVGHGRSGTE